MQALVLFQQALDEGNFKQQRWDVASPAARRVEVSLPATCFKPIFQQALLAALLRACMESTKQEHWDVASPAARRVEVSLPASQCFKPASWRSVVAALLCACLVSTEQQRWTRSCWLHTDSRACPVPTACCFKPATWRSVVAGPLLIAYAWRQPSQAAVPGSQLQPAQQTVCLSLSNADAARCSSSVPCQQAGYGLAQTQSCGCSKTHFHNNS